MQIAIAWEVPIEFIVHAPSKIAQFSLPHGAGNLKRSVFLFSSQYAFFQNYADKVRISSKLVARITRLPYMSDTRRVTYLVRFTNNILSDHLFTIWKFDSVSSYIANFLNLSFNACPLFGRPTK